jgi:N-acetylglucosaminyldiphosphoundecaprenol N-acetyl-beta-D-mannosaminyltransferase
VADLLAAKLTQQFPGLNVVGTHCPPFREPTPEEMGQVYAAIAAARPDIVWVGISTPKQERFMAGPGKAIEAPLLIGVGAAFDFHSGSVPQAPRWMQRSGLEWFFRLCVEPRRLAGRYALYNTLFVLRIAAQKIGLRRYPLD